MRALILLLGLQPLWAFQLIVQETAVTTRFHGQYWYQANFQVPPPRHPGIVIQKIDASYRIRDRRGLDCTARFQPRGAHDSYFEVFTLRPNGYSFEVDTFIDRNYGPETAGEILVWAASIAYIPVQQVLPDEAHPLHPGLRLVLPNLAPFQTGNPLTQAGDLPSTTVHADQALFPVGGYFRWLCQSSRNVILRSARITWEPGGQTEVRRTRISLSPPQAYTAYWTKHIAPVVKLPAGNG